MYCVGESYALANPIGVLQDSDQVTVEACSVDLGHYTIAKASQSQREGVESSGQKRRHLHGDQAQDALDRLVIEKTVTSYGTHA
ncbi:hypothetical protein TNCV_4407071 [Trichonephila clavipes]|nr:hypothetical protein TNCV_4407071 [Trichonephila clavipes]